MIYGELNENHIPELAKLYVEAFNSPPWNDAWTTDSASMRLMQMMSCEGSYGMICFEDGHILGLILGNHEYYYNGMHFNIKEFCVHPERKREGIGTRLLDAFLKKLKERGIDEAILFTSRTDGTEGYYARRGFNSFDDMVMMGKPLK